MDGGLVHVLRNLTSDDAKKLIQTMSLSEIDYPLRTAILLKVLEDHLFKASFSEDMLEVFEVLEKHLLHGSNPITATMKSAYCLVALDSTLKSASYPTTYLQAVDTIWRGRVLALATHGSLLFSHDLKYWKTQFDHSLFDHSQLPDTRMEAFQKVQMFLDEAWDNLYASFLHPPPPIVGYSEQRRRETMNKACLLCLGWELQSGNESLWCKVLIGKYGRGREFEHSLEAKVADSSLWKPLFKVWHEYSPYEAWNIGDGTTASAWNDCWIRTVDLIESIPDDGRHFNVAYLVDETGVWRLNEFSRLPDNVKDSIMAIPATNANMGADRCYWPRTMHASLIKDMYAAIVDDGSTDTTTSCSKIASMPIDEDSEIGESLQCSSMELENQELEDMNQEAQSEYHNANAYVANSQDDCQSINNYVANLKEAARSHEGGTTSNTVGVTLRRSKRKNFSPLKDPEPTEITKRRGKNNWTESEVDTLRSGVSKFGRKWTQIFNCGGFENRTAVDLKDKWTNILKSEAKQNKGKRNICK